MNKQLVVLTFAAFGAFMLNASAAGVADLHANQLFKNSFCLVIFLRFHEDNASKEAKVDVLRIDSQFFVCEIHGICVFASADQLGYRAGRIHNVRGLITEERNAILCGNLS